MSWRRPKLDTEISIEYGIVFYPKVDKFFNIVFLGMYILCTDACAINTLWICYVRIVQ